MKYIKLNDTDNAVRDVNSKAIIFEKSSKDKYIKNQEKRIRELENRVQKLEKIISEKLWVTQIWKEWK